MKGIAAAIVLTLSGLTALAGGTAGSADDLKAMQGQWTVTLVERDGQPAGDELNNVKVVLLVAGNEYRILADDKVISGGTLKLGAGKSPRTIDATITEGPNRGTTQPGIYEINGEKITVAFAMPGGGRPTRFKTAQRSGQSIMVYTRIKK